jgi:hypothetical protein
MGADVWIRRIDRDLTCARSWDGPMVKEEDVGRFALLLDDDRPVEGQTVSPDARLARRQIEGFADGKWMANPADHDRHARARRKAHGPVRVVQSGWRGDGDPWMQRAIPGALRRDRNRLEGDRSSHHGCCPVGVRWFGVSRRRRTSRVESYLALDDLGFVPFVHRWAILFAWSRSHDVDHADLTTEDLNSEVVRGCAASRACQLPFTPAAVENKRRIADPGTVAWGWERPSTRHRRRRSRRPVRPKSVVHRTLSVRWKIPTSRGHQERKFSACQWV